jgi:hypothetical protein
LIDKVWSAKNLTGSLQKVVAKGGSAGIDNQSARAVQEHQEQTIQKLEQELRAGQYQAQAVKRVWIPKPGSQEKRPLGVPTKSAAKAEASLLFHASSNFLASARSCSRCCGSGVLVSARAGKAMLIAKPIKATKRRMHDRHESLKTLIVTAFLSQSYNMAKNPTKARRPARCKVSF